MSTFIGASAVRAVRLALAAALALAVLAPASAQDMRIGGTGSGLGILRLLADAYGRTHPEAGIVILPSLGSEGGLKALGAGAIQLAVSSRDLTAAERHQGLESTELARTPFVFSVSVHNKVDGLSLAQLADLYAARTVHWPDGSKIRLVLRPPTDTDSAMVRRMSPVMEKAKLQAEGRAGMLFAVTDQDTQDSIERIPGALGVTSLGQIVAEGRPIKALDLDGVRPSAAALANGSYPFTKTLYLVVAPNAPATAQRFLSFVHSPLAVDILGRTGYWVH